MAIERLLLTEDLASYLQELRLSHPVNGVRLTAEGLSYSLGKSRSWASQIESRRLKYIRVSDVSAIFRLLLGENAFSSDEYKDFASRFLSETTYTDEKWYNQCQVLPFQNIRSNDLSGLLPNTKDIDLEHGLRRQLDRFKSRLINAFKNTDDPESQLIICEAVRTLNRNISYSVDSAILLNCIPLYYLNNAPADYQAKTKKILIDLLEEITIKYKPSFPSHHFLDYVDYGVLLSLLNECIRQIITANNILYSIVSDSEDISDLASEYNTIISKINAQSREFQLSEMVLSSLSIENNVSIIAIEKHIPELQKLLKELNLLKLEYKKRSDDTEGQISFDSYPE